jgi:DNA-binding transcriptional regulator YiaG
MSIVPADYDVVVRKLRMSHKLTQAALAARIGAANKAVIYQWESKRRRPSPVLWARLQTLL